MPADHTILSVLAVLFLATLIRSALGFGEALVAVPHLSPTMAHSTPGGCRPEPRCGYGRLAVTPTDRQHCRLGGAPLAGLGNP
jgi:hypothetical protein